MVGGAREGTAADGILGVVPRLVLEPASVAEAAEAMRALARDRLSVTFVGGGTDLELGAPPSALDAVLRTGRLRRLVEHAPSDQIATVEAGMPVAELQRLLAPHRQRLALDPPRPEVATVGGVVAANAFGPRRHRFGAARDVVIGMSFVRADGEPAKGGGKVVKNVAGFDVPRLIVGSLGTLALVTTVTVRLHPLPEAERTVGFAGLAAPEARDLVAQVRAAQLEPVAIAALTDGGKLETAFQFEGFAPGVAEQCRRLLALAGELGRAAEELDEAASSAFWARHDAVRSGGTLRLKITAPPAALADVASGVLQPLLRGPLGAAAAALYPTVGVAFASGDAGAGEEAAHAISQARAALAPLGGALVVTAAPAALRARLDVWGPAPASVAVMKRVKRELDPDRRLAPGRFVGGI
jgi:glycolate dehydrogenase FAD-binding subunit